MRDIATDQWDRSLSQPRHELLNISNPEDLSEGRPESGVVPEVEIEAAESFSGSETTYPFGTPTRNQILPILQQ